MKVIMGERQRILELIEGAKRGERDAFDEVIARSEERLEAFILRRVRPQLRRRLDLEAMVNDTFARAFESLARFAGSDEDSWFAWLGGIAKKVVLKEIERLKRSRTVEIVGEIAIDETSPSRALRREERLEHLEKTLEGLSRDHREVIRLCRLEGLPLEQVARRMNRSTDAVKMLLSRALEELRGRFGDTESLHLPHRPLPSEGGGE